MHSSPVNIAAWAEIIEMIGENGLFAPRYISQTTFRKACGAVDTEVGHRIIPFHEIVQSHPLMQMVFRAGFDPNNAAINGKAIEAVRNSGNHTSYANNIVARFTKIFENPPSGGWDLKSAKERLEILINEIKKALVAQPGVHVDDLKF